MKKVALNVRGCAARKSRFSCSSGTSFRTLTDNLTWLKPKRRLAWSSGVKLCNLKTHIIGWKKESLIASIFTAMIVKDRFFSLYAILYSSCNNIYNWDIRKRKMRAWFYMYFLLQRLNLGQYSVYFLVCSTLRYDIVNIGDPNRRVLYQNFPSKNFLIKI